MALNLKLQMRLSQQLIMTPQLQQAIKLLQLSRTELEELVEQALIENPVLEEDTDDGPDLSEEPIELPEMTERVGESIENEERPEHDPDWENYISSGSGVIAERHSNDEGERPSLEATLASQETLHDHLWWQLDMAPLTPLEKEIAEHMLGNLDEDGYVTVSIQDLLEYTPGLQKKIEEGRKKKNTFSLEIPTDVDPILFTTKHTPAGPAVEKKKRKKTAPVFDEDLPVEEEVKPVAKMNPKSAAVVEAVVRYLQTFDPNGVASRDLRECLSVQMRVMGLEGTLAYRIVQEDLKFLENRDLRRVAKRRKADLDDVIEAYKLIMSLEPKPGRPYGGERAQHIIPDVYIYKYHAEASEGEDRVGDYRVVLNESGMPRIKISNFYNEMTKSTPGNNDLTQEYVQEKIKAGNWLMKSIEQRQKTIFRVTKSILKHQYDFFEKGIHYLRPLVLKDVAEDIEVHESTVSRITTNKYVHTPQGIFELKYFFTSGIDQGQGEVISSKKIKDMIEKIIGGEDAREPLTDIQIAEILSEQNKIKVARRTVAKYREALNLLPSNRRKQLF